ncbi:SC3_2 [Sanghuangporus sanghuang]|uniref:Hydrophobin n=1 Tax=Sanghuangporus baumii TaxID=108892 RepID=A0A9Q5N222_SANBA|nr:fungal hydrophobin [Sanghuangporus baumii]
MFFTKYASVLALPLLAVATPWVTPTTKATSTTTVTVTATATATEPASQCNTGPIQCCDSVQSADSFTISTLLGLLGIVLEDLDVLVGLTCDPISVVGVGSSGCDAHPVCCENNDFNGLISIGCVPVNIEL